jgi:Na+/H+ antiporter NhaD/arsenite permease-like protein
MEEKSLIEIVKEFLQKQKWGLVLLFIGVVMIIFVVFTLSGCCAKIDKNIMFIDDDKGIFGDIYPEKEVV